MNQIEQYSAQLDLCVAQLRKEAPYGINPALLRLSALAEAIDCYRKHATEIIKLADTGLNNHMDRINDLENLVVARNTTITQLRELVESTEAECDEVAQISSRTIEDLNGVVVGLRNTLEVSQKANRDALGLRSQLDNARSHIVHLEDRLDATTGAEVHLSIDPGAPEGDKTVIAWTCTCGVKKSFVAPKHTDWSHETLCQCGSTTTLRL